MKNSLPLIALILFTTVPVFAEIEFHDDFDKAMAAAKESNKPIITIFSASWCGPCKQMKAKVYPSAEVTPYHDKFIWAYLDADKSKNRGLMTQLKVNGIPHISFISATGEELGNTVGSMSPTDFASKLTSILQANGTPVDPSTMTPAPAVEKKKKGLLGKLFGKD